MSRATKKSKGIFQRKNGTYFWRLKRVLENGEVVYSQKSGFKTEKEAIADLNLAKRKYNPKKCDLRKKSILFEDLFYDMLDKVPSESSKKKYLAIYTAQLEQYKGRNFMDISDEETEEALLKLEQEGYAKSYISSIKKVYNLLLKWYIHLLDYDTELQKNVQSAFEMTEILNENFEDETFKPKRISKVDFDEKTKQNKEVGLMSELFVIKFLEARGITGIHHTSRIDGDGAGYDIEVHNNSMHFYIEVKGTKGKLDNPIMLTKNEIETLKMLGEKGNIYRVYNLKYDKDKVSLFDSDRENELIESLDGEILFTSIFEIEKDLEPICYRCKIK